MIDWYNLLCEFIEEDSMPQDYEFITGEKRYE